MCVVVSENPILTWSREWPQEPGDYLWIKQWTGCGCVGDCGLASVVEGEGPVDIEYADLCYESKDGKMLYLHWCGPSGLSVRHREDGSGTGYARRPWKCDSGYMVSAFAKIDFPEPEDDMSGGYMQMPSVVHHDSFPVDTSDTPRPPSTIRPTDLAAGEKQVELKSVRYPEKPPTAEELNALIGAKHASTPEAGHTPLCQ